MFIIHKSLGKTPNQVLDELRKLPQYTGITLGYAGRLDPMAEGQLLILEGEENKRRKAYERCDKTYELVILFGIATDTYDLLGKIRAVNLDIPNNLKEKSELALNSRVGTFEQEYPPFSSPIRGGKPLYWWARAGRIHEIDIPKKMVTVYSICKPQWSIISAEEFQEKLAIMGQVKGVFRQEEIIQEWRYLLEQYPTLQLPCCRVTIHCSSGTYMRSIAHEVGRSVGVPALAWSIVRTDIKSEFV